MKFSTMTGALALSLATIVAAGPAGAVQASGAEAPRKFNFSKEAKPALAALQAAVNANDATIPAKLAAAQAVAKTNDDRYMIAQMQLKAAITANNEAALTTALEAVLASGSATQAEVPKLTTKLAELRYRAKDYDRAAAAAERVIALQPNNADMLVLLAESRNSQGRAAESVPLLQRAIKARAAAGQKAEEGWYKRAVGIAYQANLPSTLELSRDWVRAYPSVVSWRDALRIYRSVAKPDQASILDMLRLSRVTGAIESDSEYQAYAWAAYDALAAHEAKSLLDEAAAANKIDRKKPGFKEIDAAVAARLSKFTAASLANSAKEVVADPKANFALRIADAHYGLGDYGKAAELYRLALGKSGADANIVNLRLGMALAQNGDRAGAAAAFNAVTGARSELAKLWLTYLALKA